jgi:hypothetical protein
MVPQIQVNDNTSYSKAQSQLVSCLWYLTIIKEKNKIMDHFLV